MARGCHYIKLSLLSALLLSFPGMCFVFFFLSFCRFCFVLFSCSRWSVVDVPINKVSTKSGLDTICRLNLLVIFPVKLRNSFKGKYFRHLMRVLVRFPDTRIMSKFTVPHFSRGETAVHSSVERM